MKYFIFSMLLATFSAVPGFAGETNTECVQMHETTSRNNPKANQPVTKEKPRDVNKGSSSQ